MCIFCIMITTVRLVNTSVTSQLTFVCGKDVEDLLSQQLSIIQYSNVNILTKLYIIFAELTHLVIGSLCPLITFINFPHPSRPQQPPHLSEIIQYLSFSHLLYLA